MLKLVLLFGNSSVGKMTVGQELTKITDLKLFHNHMTIEPVLEIFGNFNTAVISQMREIIFQEFAKTNQYGLIFTFMWAFDQQSDWDYIEHVCDIFRKQNAEIYYVELVASQEVRLQRNSTENRLKHKASKRDLEMSNALLLDHDKKYRCISNDGEITFDNYFKINNTDLSAETAAQMIRERFKL